MMMMMMMVDGGDFYRVGVWLKIHATRDALKVLRFSINKTIEKKLKSDVFKNNDRVESFYGAWSILVSNRSSGRLFHRKGAEC